MLPPTPDGLSQQQLKRRHIVAAIIHSENSYVATLQRLVNVRISSKSQLSWPKIKLILNFSHSFRIIKSL